MLLHDTPYDWLWLWDCGCASVSVRLWERCDLRRWNPWPWAAQGRLQTADCAWNKPQRVGGCFCPCPCLVLSRSAYSVIISCCGGQTSFQALSCSAFSVVLRGYLQRMLRALMVSIFKYTDSVLCSQCVDILVKKKKKRLSQISEACALTVYICFYFIFVGTFPQGTNKGVYLLVRNNPLAWMTIGNIIFSSSKSWSSLSSSSPLKPCILSFCYLPDCANCFICFLSWAINSSPRWPSSLSLWVMRMRLSQVT